MSKAVADRLLKAKGMPEVEQRLNALGWHWIPGVRKFWQPLPIREAA